MYYGQNGNYMQDLNYYNQNPNYTYNPYMQNNTYPNQNNRSMNNMGNMNTPMRQPQQKILQIVIAQEPIRLVQGGSTTTTTNASANRSNSLLRDLIKIMILNEILARRQNNPMMMNTNMPNGNMNQNMFM